jgi:hypothetical protein
MTPGAPGPPGAALPGPVAVWFAPDPPLTVLRPSVALGFGLPGMTATIRTIAATAAMNGW